MAPRQNQGFLVDDGTNMTPRGVRWWATAANTLNGHPFAMSTAMPSTGSSGKVFLVNLADLVIGEALAVNVTPRPRPMSKR